MWGPKAEELRRFLRLPALAGEPIEIALESGSGDELVGELAQNGWRVESAEAVASTPDSYGLRTSVDDRAADRARSLRRPPRPSGAPRSDGGEQIGTAWVHPTRLAGGRRLAALE